MNQKNILYIWGAGASANALPTVNQMVIRMKVYAFWLFSLRNTDDEDLLEKVIDLIKKVEIRRSFDTYAKEIFIKDNDNRKTNDIKNVLVKYLSFEQEYSDENLRRKIISTYGWIPLLLIKKDKKKFDLEIDNVIKKYIEKKEKDIKVFFDNRRDWIKEVIKYIFDCDENIKYFNNKSNLDLRYINFLVDVLGTNENESVKKIKILSWNYDTQLKNATEALKIKDNFQKKKDNVLNVLDQIEIKINGSLIDKEKIKFAWEPENNFNIINEVKKYEEWYRNMSDIIVIGYSFPFSNRKIDLGIFKQIIYSRRVNIYIQTVESNKDSEDKDKNFNDIKEAVESLIISNGHGSLLGNEIKIFKKYDNNSFFIPPHY